VKWDNFHFYYTDHIEVPMPPGHRFPMEKYRLLHEAVLRDGLVRPDQLFPAPHADKIDLLKAHDQFYVDGLFQNSLTEKELRPIGLPWSEILLKRSTAAVGGFIEASEKALLNGFSALLAGGTHHAHAGSGEGYCVFNDFACAAIRLLDLKKAKKILIIDLDVHQGNGNSSILGKRDDVFILSLHGEKNYPFRKVPSHLDVALPLHCSDELYLKSLDQALKNLPTDWDIIFYQAGVDNLKEDVLGTFDLSFEGLMARDQMVFEYAGHKPIAMAIGGGYAKPIELTVNAHLNTLRVAKNFFN
jgi:acetoin utilization deacetylase AcuC-like enzyme